MLELYGLLLQNAAALGTVNRKLALLHYVAAPGCSLADPVEPLPRQLTSQQDFEARLARALGAISEDRALQEELLAQILQDAASSWAPAQAQAQAQAQAPWRPAQEAPLEGPAAKASGGCRAERWRPAELDASLDALPFPAGPLGADVADPTSPATTEAAEGALPPLEGLSWELYRSLCFDAASGFLQPDRVALVNGKFALRSRSLHQSLDAAGWAAPPPPEPLSAHFATYADFRQSLHHALLAIATTPRAQEEVLAEILAELWRRHGRPPALGPEHSTASSSPLSSAAAPQGRAGGAAVRRKLQEQPQRGPPHAGEPFTAPPGGWGHPHPPPSSSWDYPSSPPSSVHDPPPPPPPPPLRPSAGPWGAAATPERGGGFQRGRGPTVLQGPAAAGGPPPPWAIPAASPRGVGLPQLLVCPAPTTPAQLLPLHVLQPAGPPRRGPAAGGVPPGSDRQLHAAKLDTLKVIGGQVLTISKLATKRALELVAESTAQAADTATNWWGPGAMDDDEETASLASSDGHESEASWSTPPPPLPSGAPPSPLPSSVQRELQGPVRRGAQAPRGVLEPASQGQSFDEQHVVDQSSWTLTPLTGRSGASTALGPEQKHRLTPPNLNLLPQTAAQFLEENNRYFYQQRLRKRN